MIVVLVLTVLAVVGCATPGEELLVSTVNNHPPGGSGLVVNQIGDETEVFSYGRVSGTTTRPIEVDDLRVLDESIRPWGKFQLAAHKDDFDILRNALISDDPEKMGMIRNALLLALDESIATMAGLSNDSLEIYAVAALSGSGRSMLFRERAADSLSLMVIDGVTFPSEVPSFNEPSYWMTQIGSTVVHELFHLNNRMQEVEVPNVNEETAAYLLGYCFVARMARNLGVSSSMEFDVSSPLIQSVFPGIAQGEFNPQANELEDLGHPSRQGNNLAKAALMHISKGGPLEVNNPDMFGRMTEICDRSVEAIPDFRAGNLP